MNLFRLLCGCSTTLVNSVNAPDISSYLYVSNRKSDEIPILARVLKHCNNVAGKVYDGLLSGRLSKFLNVVHCDEKFVPFEMQPRVPSPYVFYTYD